MILTDQAHVPYEDWAIFYGVFYLKSQFMKPFSTHRQQLKILRDRGLNTGNGSKSMRILERENYYNLINGYKDLFLKTESNGNNIVPEE
ncbi:Abi family protein [Salipaludibacillus neizhouensis]|uniref:hypothetical protein n=1 Tax=Salipaludibacillus neizhouensis TaxID=885475 RepID=UPI001C7CB0DA|nr:hypothetical protein [Salipaludibacillus neizhouensis]